jgi:putative membrane protein
VRLVGAIFVNTVAVAVAIIVLPQIEFAGDAWRLVLLGLILGVINAFLAPVLKAVAFPINLLTLGLFTFVVNTGLLLLAAWIAGELDVPFSVGGFPPDLAADALVAAFLGSLIISAVSTLLSVLGKVTPV